MRDRIERLAGTGGMGAVYRAEDLEAGGHAAIKVMVRLAVRTRGSRIIPTPLETASMPV